MLQLAIAAILIICNGLFALSELAIVSSRKARLDALAETGNRGAQAALRLLEQPGRFLSTVQIGITLVGILAGAFSGAALGADVAAWLHQLGLKRWLAEPAGYASVLGLITYFSVVIGELVPKHLALRNPEPFACAMARPMTLLSKAAAPMVWLLDSSARLVIRMLGATPEGEVRVTDEEIRALIAEAARTGVIADDEREMIAAVLRFGDRNARSVMTPRVDISPIDIQADRDTVLQQIRSSTHSIVLVADGNPDRIIGAIRARDVLAGGPTDGAAAAGQEFLRKHMFRAPAVPDSASALQALHLLRNSSVPVAIVRDEYGNFEGIITPADILDAIAGAFRSDTLPREQTAQQHVDGSWRLAGQMPVDEAAELLGIRLPEHRGFATLGGYLITLLGRIPETGDIVETDDWRFEILSMQDLRIGSVSARRPPATGNGAD